MRALAIPLYFSLGAALSSCGADTPSWRHAQCEQQHGERRGSLGEKAVFRADLGIWERSRQRMGIEALREPSAPGDLQLRIWSATRLDRMDEGLELTRHEGAWSARRYRFFDSDAMLSARCETLEHTTSGILCSWAAPMPQHWSGQFRALEKIGFRELPGDWRLDGERTREPLGVWYFVESRDAAGVKAYTFTDPLGESCRQSERFVLGMRLLNRAFEFGLTDA